MGGDQTKHKWGSNETVAALPRDHANCAQAVVGVPIEAPTGQKDRETPWDTHPHTHAPTELFFLVGLDLRPTTLADLLPSTYY